MKVIASGLLALSLLFMVADRSYARCGDEPGDDAAVAAARAQVEIDCSCAGSPNHGSYVACAASVATARAHDGLLPNNCRSAVVKCAAKSTCGKPGFVTCCRTNSKGATKCSTKSDALRCKAPKDGSACVGSLSSCCDACTETGCASSPSGAFLDGGPATHF